MGRTIEADTRVTPGDDAFMARALDLASRGTWRTDPNPRVGSVVVRDGNVVGEGFHERCGAPHAEAVALEAAGNRAKGATLYASLEPCSHHGKTPPCVERVVAGGIKRVVVPTRDPDHRVFGAGISALRGAGIEVVEACHAVDAILMNLAYFKEKLGLGRIVTLKMGGTLDGRIARSPGNRNEVTSPRARAMGHELRATHDAVVVGIETVLTDNPRLDCRLAPGDAPLPVPVVLDAALRFSGSGVWRRTGRSFVVATGHDAPRSRVAAIESAGGTVVRCGVVGGRVDLSSLLDQLEARGYRRILVEGGGRVFASFIAAGEWDAFVFFQSPKFFGTTGVAMFGDGEAVDPDVVAGEPARVGNDTMLRFVNGRVWRSIVDALETGRRD